MKTILFTNKYAGRPLEIVREELPAGFEIAFLPAQTPEADLPAVCPDSLAARMRFSSACICASTSSMTSFWRRRSFLSRTPLSVFLLPSPFRYFFTSAMARL